MNFFDYINVPPSLFKTAYLDTGLVQKQTHDTFPLDIYTYGRKAQFDNVWDGVTSKCRGIIVNRETGEVVARPFEKFHNHGSVHAMNTFNPVTEADLRQQPVIWEKMDGFMATLYRWDGVDYIASKGSFHSIHAKWATAQLRKTWGETLPFHLPGHTLVFEGLCRDLRIVVDYGTREGLVLLAVINNETGEEFTPCKLQYHARALGFDSPQRVDMTLERAREESLKEYRDGLGTDEGYVLTWYQDGKPPKRLKMKFIDYLRLHRMVCGVTPWRVWEALVQGNSEAFTEWTESRAPWFVKFVEKWRAALVTEKARHHIRTVRLFEEAVAAVGVRPSAETSRIHNIRRAFSQEFTTGESKKYSAALFKMLDKRDPNPIFWKYVEGMTSGSAPCRDPRL